MKTIAKITCGSIPQLPTLSKPTVRRSVLRRLFGETLLFLVLIASPTFAQTNDVLTFMERTSTNSPRLLFLRFLPPVRISTPMDPYILTTNLPVRDFIDAAVDAQGVFHLVSVASSPSGYPAFRYYQTADEVALRSSFSPGYTIYQGTDTNTPLSVSVAIDKEDNVHFVYLVAKSTNEESTISIYYRNLLDLVCPLDGRPNKRFSTL